VGKTKEEDKMSANGSGSMILVDYLGRPLPLPQGNGDKPPLRQADGQHLVRTIGVRLTKSKEFGKQGWRTIEMSSWAELQDGADPSYERNSLYEAVKHDLEMLFEPWEIEAGTPNGGRGYRNG
jgi:hypothetical protein